MNRMIAVLTTLILVWTNGPLESAEPGITAPPGFVVEKIFEVPTETMGSWSALTRDDHGRLIASDEKNLGLFLITPPKIGDADAKAVVEKLPVDMEGAHGMLWAFDSLYVHVQRKGLFRVTDTDQDGRVDSAKLLMANQGGGGHAQHAVVLAPDGKSLYVAGGNHTFLPDQLAGSRLPQNWSEDLLLPRRWDARGHAAGKLAPGGWICQVSPDGKDWTVVSTGYRNQYDMAFNGDGELFTYDADMEWDMGMPWYRPTRFIHATSGSELGWRSGTGKWPAYYEDSLGSVLEIGPGSPTGVLFGTGAKFPARYQRACFLLDWTYSTIHAMHLTPHGASYKATKEDFVVGGPMAVTDAVIGLDGAMYFVVGGRRSQSALYRVTYEGNDSTAPTDLRNKKGAEPRALRKRLEQMHVGQSVDFDLIFDHLGNTDRYIRYAARIALEQQPVAQWRGRALGAKDSMASVVAMIALSRQGSESDQGPLLKNLAAVDFKALSRSGQLALLRAYQLAFVRLGEPSEVTRVQLVKKLGPLFPHEDDHVSKELVRLLVYLRDPQVIAKSLALAETLGPETIPNWGKVITRNERYGSTVAAMLKDMPPARKIHLLLVLRNVKEGWTLPQRKQYFNMFVGASRHPGGNSYAGFLRQIRDDAWATCTPGEKVVLGDLVGRPLGSKPFVSKPAQGPMRTWTKEAALAALEKPLRKRSLAAGRNLFHATQCAKCHRFAGEGGAVGPDLSTALQKYSIADLLDSMLTPSKVISDQYGSHQVTTDAGKVLVGRAVEVGKELFVYTVESGARPIIIKKDEVDEMVVSKVSQMPAGLMNALNEEELRDLIAYLQSGGNPKWKGYR